MKLSDHNLQLETFHHLLHDQLMPWLPENNSLPFYKAWEHYVHQHEGPYLMGLLKVYERNRRTLSPVLTEEWTVICRTKLKPEIQELVLALKNKKFSGIKLFFYRDLIVYAFAHSLSYFELQLEHFSDARKQFALRQLMRRLDDLYSSSIKLFRLQQTEDAAVVYLVHLCVVLFRERLIKHSFEALSPGFILLKKDLIQPDHLKDYPMHQLLNALYQGYHQDYLRYLTKKQKPFPMSEEQPNRSGQEVDSLLQKLGEAAAPEAISSFSLPQQASIGSTNQAKTESRGPLLSTAQAAEMLGLSDNWLREKAKRGEIPYLKIGRLMKYEQAALDQYLSKNRT